MSVETVRNKRIVRASGRSRLPTLWQWARLAAALLVLRVTLGVVAGYVDYFPPNFFSEFLTGRNHYFFGAYQVAFTIHILCSPLVIVSGLLLMNGSVRRRYSTFHRRLGRVHILTVLLLVVPSSLWMSLYAATGNWAGAAFALTALMTGWCAVMGWRSGVHRQFARHQIWMTRCYLLLCSAIVLRVLSGLATVMGCDALWTYPMFAWISSVVPLTVYEVGRIKVLTAEKTKRQAL